MIIQAIEFAHLCHLGQTRKDGKTPYITHPIWVAYRTALLPNCTEDMYVAALLHDSCEDAGISRAALEDKFNKNVADIVWELTNQYVHHPFGRKEKKELETQRLASASKEARLIKIVDRLHNVSSRTVKGQEYHMKKNYLPESEYLLKCVGGLDKELDRELAAAIKEKYESLK